jgi:hypothetical protein
VEDVAKRLRDEARVHPFLSKWHLVPGEEWIPALARALGRSSTVAVFFGSGGMGAWHEQESQLALILAAQERGKRVIPVLLPDAQTENDSGFLKLRTPVNLARPDGFDRLVAGIRGFAPGSHEVIDQAIEIRKTFEKVDLPVDLQAIAIVLAGGQANTNTLWILSRMAARVRSRLRRYRVKAGAVVLGVGGIALASAAYERFSFSLTVEFPTSVDEHDPLVGGKHNRIDPSLETIWIYVCTEVRRSDSIALSPECWLQQYPEPVKIFSDGSWSGRARFGNVDSQDNDKQDEVEFRVFAVAGPKKLVLDLPAYFPGGDDELLSTFYDSNFRASKPHIVVRQVFETPTPPWFTQIRDASGVTMTFTAPPSARYLLCPPVTVGWQHNEASTINYELWKNGVLTATEEQVTRVTVDELHPLDETEIKISAGRRREPYRSIYLYLGSNCEAWRDYGP